MIPAMEYKTYFYGNLSYRFEPKLFEILGAYLGAKLCYGHKVSRLKDLQDRILVSQWTPSYRIRFSCSQFTNIIWAAFVPIF